MRLDIGLHRRLSDFAYERKISTSAAARQLIDEGLKLHQDENEALADLLTAAAEKLRNQE
jgi:hypothetical protein